MPAFDLRFHALLGGLEHAFIGPTGVGKTEMAKAVAEFFYQDRRRMTRIDLNCPAGTGPRRLAVRHSGR